MASRGKKAGKVNWELIIGITVAICIVLVAILIALLYANRHSVSPSASIGSPQYWKTANNQMTLKTKDITFAIKNIDISHQEFRFFYIEKASQKVSIHAFSFVNQNKSIPLDTQSQSLGMLGSYAVNVLHIDRIDRIGQVITLQITMQGTSTIQTLSPLQQRLVDKNPNGSVNISVDQEQLTDIIWFGPVMQQQVAFFKLTPTSPSTSSPNHIFLRFDSPVTVVTISQSQYLAIAGQQNYS